MTVILSVDFVGAKSLIRKLNAANKNLSAGQMEDIWENIVSIVALSARQYAPRWKGDIASNIEEEVRGQADTLRGIVFTDIYYAPFQERGTAPYFPDYTSQSLVDWAADHNIDVWLVALAIAARGIVPIKFFERALLENETEIVRNVGNVAAEILEKNY